MEIGKVVKSREKSVASIAAHPRCSQYARAKAEVSGYLVLFVGVALLVFTFINAYLFLTGGLDIPAIEDWVADLGELLGPLVETCIRIMYLGIMGWIGALLTKRGIEFLTKLPREARKEPEKKDSD